VFSYSAICDVPAEPLMLVSGSLAAHRRRIGTSAGRRAAAVRVQSKLVLCWFRDDASLRQLAGDARLPISTDCRYLHEAIDVIAEQAPALHDVLEQGRQLGWSHVSMDGTLIEIDRGSPAATSTAPPVVLGQAQNPRRQRADRRRPTWVPRLVRSGRTGQRPRHHRRPRPFLGALYAAAVRGLPTLADTGYAAPACTPRSRSVAPPSTSPATTPCSLPCGLIGQGQQAAGLRRRYNSRSPATGSVYPG